MIGKILRTANPGGPTTDGGTYMTAERLFQNPHSTVRRGRLKVAAMAWGVFLAVAGFGQVAESGGNAELRAEITRLLRAGPPEAAVRYAQAALSQKPNDPGVRQEYVTLHVALARRWLAAGEYDACLAAAEAVLALEPRNEPALALRREIAAARQQAGPYVGQVEELLRMELFGAALDRLKELKQLRPDLADTLASSQQAAWLGAADDHYLARDFNEAFVLYEQVLVIAPDSAADVYSRWAVSLALALSESDFSETMDANTAGRFLARAIDVLRKTNEPVVGQVVGGLLAERAGQLIDAGQTYAQAVGKPWVLPPADRRREAITQLRQEAVQRVRDLYQATPTRRREGMWSVALPNLWKNRQTAHFDVYARNDLVAGRVAETLEFHYSRLAEWLGVTAAATWEPRLEIRVHVTQVDLHKSTGTKGITRAVSHTRLQGDAVALRKLEVFQADPWLLGATLPHELTHAILADAYRQAGPPLAIDEGLALQSEPPARRLMYRRLLAGSSPEPAKLLAAAQLPADLERFYADCDALTGWLLDRQGGRTATATQPSPVPALVATTRAEAAGKWWERFGWKTAAEADADWRTWLAARREPPRMPLMILVEPSPEHRQGAKEQPRKEPQPERRNGR
jgi:tetratricopeptide (TPR) repeat protein